MIKANELRLGNLLQYDKKTIFIAEILKDNNVIVYDGYGFEKGEPLQCLRPIQLTEEWLIKFGLKDKIFKDIEYFSVELSSEWCSLYFEGNYTAVDFKYVHQLQNIYFALTGEELTINT